MNLLILPLIFLTYVFRKQLSGLTTRLPLSFSFPSLTVVFGLCIETFAILDNLHKPLAERILLSPYPLTDLFFGIFYYGLVGITWYFLLKKIFFNKKDVFFLTGLVLGIGTEQGGAIFIGAFSSLGGFLLALIIASIYGVFPMLAYLLTEQQFSPNRRRKTILSYLIAASVLLMQWALFGLFILPLLKALG